MKIREPNVIIKSIKEGEICEMFNYLICCILNSILLFFVLFGFERYHKLKEKKTKHAVIPIETVPHLKVHYHIPLAPTEIGVPQ